MSSSSLAVRDSPFLRLLKALRLVEVRPDGSTTHEAGADWATDSGASPGYPHLNSLSAMASFPWVYSAVNALATDLSKVAIRAKRGRGADAEPLEDHPLLDLLDQPSTRVPGTLWRRQLITDLVLSGDAYVLIVGASEPEALLRLHPSRVKIIPLSDGQPDSYEYDGGGRPAEYGYEQVLHVRTPSWSDDPRGLYGVGAIQSLHDDLLTERSTAALTASTAKTGRPTGIISPAEDGDRWSRDQITLVREAYEGQMQKGAGVLIVGGAVNYEPVGWSPREMEVSSVRELTREAILAALDVPPARVGLPKTNYATANAQSRRYWEGLQGRASLIDAEFTRLARMFPDSDDVTIYHDFSDVDSLQESRTERVSRVLSWSMLGLPAEDAAALEGFDEFPTSAFEEAATGGPGAEAEPGAEPAEEPGAGDSPLASTALNGAQIASLLSIIANVAAGAISNDAALAIIAAAFPTIDDATASRILAGAQTVPTDADEEMLENGYPTEEEVEEELRELEELRTVIDGEMEELRTILDGELEDPSDEERDGGEWLALETASADERLAEWKGLMDDIHSPMEKELAKAVRVHLRGQAARTAARLEEKLGNQRGAAAIAVKRAALGDEWRAELLNLAAEKVALIRATLPTFTKTVRRAFERAMSDVGLGDVAITDAAIDTISRRNAKNMANEMDKLLFDTLGKKINDMLDEGATIGDLQQMLYKDHGFSPERALRVARTETTKSMSAGQRAAFEDSADRGVPLLIEWMAFPGARSAHAALDGQKVEPGEKFTVPPGVPGAGKTALHPGVFDSAALNVNCRCTITGKVQRKT